MKTLRLLASCALAVLTVISAQLLPPAPAQASSTIKPDVIISETHGYQLMPGSTVYRVHFTVKNIGTVPVPSGFVVGMTRNGANVSELRTVTRTLAAGETYSDAFSTNFSWTSAPDDTFTVTADFLNAVEEVSEANNSLTNTYPNLGTGLPDIVVNEQRVYWATGSNQTRYWDRIVIRNIGSGPAGDFYVGVKVDGMLQTELQRIVSLEPNAEAVLAFPAWPALQTISGISDTVEIIADINGQVVESDENNNNLVDTVWGLLPDLGVADQHEEWTDSTNTSYRVYFMIQNYGQTVAPAGSLVGVTINGIPIAEQIPVPVDLAYGESWSGNFTTNFTPTPPGSDNITVIADVTDLLVESADWNNQWTKTFPPPPPPPGQPDLIMLWKNEQWEPGLMGIAYTVSFGVQNAGTAPFYGGSVGLSIDGVLRTDRMYIPTLQPDQIYSSTFMYVYSYDDGESIITIEEPVIVGMTGISDTVQVIADPDNAITELNEDNNTLTNTLSAQVLMLASPNGGENWIEGSNRSITWASVNITSNVSIQLTRDAGTTWETLAANTANDGTEQWTVSGPATSQARIRITSIADPLINDLSEVFFNILLSPSITVVSPNGAENWVVGTSYNITWNSSNVPGNVNIHISRDSGASWSTLYANIANTGSISWNTTGPSASQARVRVSAVSAIAPAADFSDADFSIVTNALNNSLIASVSPNITAPGQTVDVMIIGINLTQVYAVDFGPGTTNAILENFSGTYILTRVTVDPAAPLSTRNLKLVTGSGNITTAALFTVSNSAPLISDIVPNHMNTGETGNVVLTGTNLLGTYNADFGVGVTVNSLVVHNATQITVSITVDTETYLGSRNVVANSPSGTASVIDGFNVTTMSPIINSVIPGQAIAGTTLSANIDGANFAGATSVSFGNGVIVNNFTVIDPTRITVNLTIAANATTGWRTVIVTAPLGTGFLSAFRVLGLPTITSITPNSHATGGTQFEIIIYGTGFTGGTPVVSFGNNSGITQDSGSIYYNEHRISLLVSVNSSAQVGYRDVSVTTPVGTTTLTNGFRVTGSPQVTGLVPSGVPAGQTRDVVINGFNFVDVSACYFGPLSPATINSYQVINSTQIKANISVAATATPNTIEYGALVTPDGSTSFFIHILPAPPQIFAVNPNVSQPGQFRWITITGARLNNVSAVDFGPGITTYGNIAVDNSSQIRIGINISPDAEPGSRNVSVTSPSGSGVLVNGFTVAGPYIASITPGQGRQGETIVVSINGTYLTSITDISLGTGVTVSNITVTPTLLTATFTVALDALPGWREVTFITATGNFPEHNAFYVIDITPWIGTVFPFRGVQGQSLNVEITGRNFDGILGLDFGSGITVNSFHVDSSTHVSAAISIAGDAPLGPRYVTVTTSSGTYSSQPLFEVFTGTLNITGVIPAGHSPDGTLFYAAIRGSGFQGPATLDFGPGVTAEAYEISPTEILARVTVAPGAAVGYRNVTVNTTSGSVTLVNGFRVSGVPFVPRNMYGPAPGIPKGQTSNVTLNGGNFVDVSAVTFVGRSDIVVNSFQVLSTTQIVASISVAGSVPNGAVWGKIYTPDGFADFEVIILDALPTLVSVSPDKSLPGSFIHSANITGTNLGATTNFSFGPGITWGFNPFFGDNSTQLRIYIAVEPGAALGPRDVTVTTLSGSAVLHNGFTVVDMASFTASPVPAAPGQNVTFNVSYTYPDELASWVHYFWQFGDGTTGNGTAVMHAYPASGNFTVNLTVTNDNSLLTSSTTRVIEIRPSNQPPALETIGNRAISEGKLLTFTISAADVDGDSLIYTAFNLPSGAVFDAGNRTFSWTPGYDQSGNYTVRFQVSDGTLTDSEDVVITVVNAVVTINATAGPGGFISPSGLVLVDYGGNQSFNITAADGYRVVDVQIDGSSAGPRSVYSMHNVTANHTISALFAVESYTITASAGPGGSISPSGVISANYGANRSFAVTPAVGFHIASVLIDGVSAGTVNTYSFVNVTANHSISASFAVNSYTVNASVADGRGSVSPASQSVNFSRNASITIVPETGYRISTITDNGVSKPVANPYIVANVTANHTVVVSFAAIPVGLRQTKQAILNDLTTLAGNVTDKHDREKLDDAIKHFNKSLTPSWWADDSHLAPKYGGSVFNEEKNAVTKLRELLEDKKCSIPASVLRGFIARILDVDRQLAQTAITGSSADREDIAKAREELASGDADAAKGKYESAIEHYRNAWEHAGKKADDKIEERSKDSEERDDHLPRGSDSGDVNKSSSS